MRNTATAIANVQDWTAPLLECNTDPVEGYLHDSLSSGYVLPISLALALAYEYPCTLGQQQPGLHQWLVYSSVYGIPLIVSAEALGIRIQHHREYAARSIRIGTLGYVTDKCNHRGPSNHDEMLNQWNRRHTHYKCHHDECFMTGTARMYFTSEEEYLAKMELVPHHRDPVACLSHHNMHLYSHWRARYFKQVSGTCGRTPFNQPHGQAAGEGK